MASEGVGSLNPAVSAFFNSLTQGNSFCAEYVWIGGNGDDIRSKTRTFPVTKVVKSPADLPIWNYDGSSTGQAPGRDSEVLLKPCAIFPDPFRGGNNILVLCETLLPNLKPLNHMVDNWGVNGNNNRAGAMEVFENNAVKEQEPWFGLEQEYTLFCEDGKQVLGWPKNGYPRPQGPYYCSVGVTNSFGRDVVDAHLKACLYAGVKISGTNAEVMPGQHEFQIGPCLGIESGDHLWMARYLMHRVCEKFNVHCSFHPKPIVGDWNGAGCHSNFSTKDMRDPALVFEYKPTSGPYAGKTLTGGFAKIIEGCDRMGKPGRPAEHLKVYGPCNDMRLTGKHETASMNSWSYGVADRGASIRIPRETEREGYGYLEDRRPASNIDPYNVTARLCKTIILDL